MKWGIGETVARSIRFLFDCESTLFDGECIRDRAKWCFLKDVVIVSPGGGFRKTSVWARSEAEKVWSGILRREIREVRI
jgi:hypothetical protein